MCRASSGLTRPCGSALQRLSIILPIALSWQIVPAALHVRSAMAALPPASHFFPDAAAARLADAAGRGDAAAVHQLVC